MTGEPGELAALRDAFPGYRFRRRDFRGVPGYLAEARWPADAPLAAARNPEILADMLAAAAGRPVRLRPAAVATAYRDRLMTVQQCAAMFGVSRTTIMKFLAAQGVALRRPGDDVDDQAVVTAYRDEGLSLHDCAVRFGISQRRVAAALERHGVPRRPVGRPPRHLRRSLQDPLSGRPDAVTVEVGELRLPRLGQPQRCSTISIGVYGSRASSFAATSVRSSPTTSGGSNRVPKPPDLRLTQPVVSPARLAP